MKIRGVSSGDGECWCFLVTRHTYRKVTGKSPTRWDRQHRGVQKGSAYKYKLYPGHLIGWDLGNTIVDLEISARPVVAAKKGRKARC